MPNWYRPTALPIDPFGTPDRGYGSFRVTSPFGWRDNPLNPGHKVFHGALDLGNGRLRDTVVAVADGTVAAVGNLLLPWSQPTTQWPSGNYGGLMIILDHGSHTSLYAHLRSESVTAGQKVTAGQPIGLVGESGSATGRGHLHFGIIARTVAYVVQQGILVRNDWTIDPWPLIESHAGSGALPDTALPGEDMPKILERVKGEEAIIPRAGIPLRTAPTTSGTTAGEGDCYYVTAVPNEQVQPYAVVEGTAYGVSGGTSVRYLAYVTSNLVHGYLPEVYAERRPLADCEAAVNEAKAPLLLEVAGLKTRITTIKGKANNARAFLRDLADD